MPTHKDFKRVVRRRMQKTGESYTAARAQLLNTVPASPSAARARLDATDSPARSERALKQDAQPLTKPDFAKLAGMSDAAVKDATGCNWERWVWALDRVEAHTWPHRKITEYVRSKYKTPDWWTQMVTVGYERIRGLRQIGQRRGGGYEASKSRTFAVPVAALYRAIATPRARDKWMPGVQHTVRTRQPNKSLRITWEDGTPVDFWLVSKGAKKSTVQVQHGRLPDRAAVDRIKAQWSERLDSLGTVLAS